MATESIPDQIHSRVEAFVADLTDLFRQSTISAIHQALGGNGVAPKRGRPAAVSMRSAPSAAGRLRAKGAKRPPEELETLTAQLLAYVKSNSGQRIEQIAQGMGVSTKDLALPAKKLIADKKVRTKGQKRATQYLSR